MTKVSFSFWDMGMEFGIGIVGLAFLDFCFERIPTRIYTLPLVMVSFQEWR